MRKFGMLCLALGACLQGTAQAQSDGLVEGLLGTQGLTGAAAGAAGAASSPLLEGVESGTQGLLSDGLGAVPGGVLAVPGAERATLEALQAESTSMALPGLEAISVPEGQVLAGDLGADLLVPRERLAEAGIEPAVSLPPAALPAGVLPEDYPIDVQALGGVSPALKPMVTHGRIAAGLLPADLPVFDEAIDPEVMERVLERGIPAALLPKLAVVPESLL